MNAARSKRGAVKLPLSNMKHFWLALTLALSLQLAGANTARAQTASLGATLDAAQILRKSLQTYGKLQTYQGTCAVTSEAVIDVEGRGRQHIAQNAQATIKFERGKRLSIEGTLMGGDPFRALSTPKETWDEFQRRDDAPGKMTRETVKGDNVLTATETLLAGLSGVTGGAASTIPDLFAPDPVSNPYAILGTVKRLPDQTIGASDCYVLEQNVPELNTVTTYWIEKNSFLLRRKQEEQGEMDFGDLPAVPGVKVEKMKGIYSMSFFVFVNDVAK